MSGTPGGAAGGYLRFLVWVAVSTAAAMLVGAWPTRALGGDGALPAMAAGCVISALGSAVGGLPYALARGAAPESAATRALLGSVLRPLVVLGLGLAAVLPGRFPAAPLLVWLAISYALLLVPDTRYALKASGDATKRP